MDVCESLIGKHHFLSEIIRTRRDLKRLICEITSAFSSYARVLLLRTLCYGSLQLDLHPRLSLSLLKLQQHVLLPEH